MRYQISLQKHPEYLNRKMLLINEKKDQLFCNNNGDHIEINFAQTGEMTAYKITDNIKKIEIKQSLRKIGIDCLGFNDPSVPKMLKHLVIPEMEIERIFNHLRYRYLNSIKLSGFSDPSKQISSTYNRAFLALMGHQVYQGNTKKRVENDYFWKNAGFSEKAKKDSPTNNLKEDLSFILRYIKHQLKHEQDRVYRELIAIKPGFHELIVHPEYFSEKIYGEKPRAKVFRALRGRTESSNLQLTKMPGEINKGNYFSYGSCNVTEGPFVFRKTISNSYYDGIRKIKSKDELPILENEFYILPYHNESTNPLTSVEKLEKTIGEAKKFLKFIT